MKYFLYCKVLDTYMGNSGSTTSNIELALCFDTTAEAAKKLLQTTSDSQGYGIWDYESLFYIKAS